MRLRLNLLSGIAAASLLALGACGSETERAVPADAAPSGNAERAPSGNAAELAHIHGLGEDPRTKELFVATHYGLFRAPREQTRLQRAGASRQDTMGFSVVDTGRFLGSGHPDPADGGPPALGLIASADQGRSWKSISLAGRADFHVLRSSGRQVYGADSGSGAVMVSSDGGETWTRRKPPGDLYDLAIDPESPRHVVASTAIGIFTSRDAGARWRRVNGDAAGLLAWTGRSGLVLVDANGAVSRSDDGGRTFAPAGGVVGSTPSAFVATADGLLAALGDGTVLCSDDGGSSWQVRARP
ncbi:MAG: F510_1955 family glycosylhydrolase [Solirubrobacteraceae bacterium]